MKRIKYFFLVILLSFCFINTVFAQNSKKATDIYCSGEEGAKGCVYQGNEKDFKFLAPIIYSESINTHATATIFIRNATLTKAYTATDSNNNLVYAACYKVDARNNPEKVDATNVDENTLKKYKNAVYYVFHVYTSNAFGDCNYNVPQTIVYQATSNTNSTTHALEVYNHQQVNRVAKVDGWDNNALNGSCPKYFGSAQLSSGGLKYVFTDYASNLKNNDYINNGLDASCTVEDTEAEKTISACFNNKIQELKNKLQSRECPSDIASLKDLEKITSEYTKVDDCLSLGDGNTYSYSIIKKISDNYKISVTNAVKTKYFSCALDICGLTDSEKSRVRDRVGSIYEDSDIGNLYSSGLDSSKISCLTSNVKKSDSIVEDIQNAIDDAAKKKAEENNIERDTTSFTPVELKISDEPMSCEQMLGGVLHKVVKSSIRIVQVVAAIMAIVKGMLLIVPSVTSKDAEELKKVSGTLVKLAIVLVIIFILGPTVRLFGSLLGYDVSCLI